MDQRDKIRSAAFADETQITAELLDVLNVSQQERARMSKIGTDLVHEIRTQARPSLMELFLSEYGLSSEEGVALMCLAEALLRVPDAATIDDLIEDKIAPSAWSDHLGRSHSPLINASTWALMLTGRVLDDRGQGIAANLRGLIKRVGEPVIRTAVGHAMREMGRQFVLGETIAKAMARAAAMEAKGYLYSYDMLGEAARTEADAHRYHVAYAQAITEIAQKATGSDITQNPGISIKLSALHPRYEPLQRCRVREDLVPRVMSLVSLAKSAQIGLNIDAEEAARLDLSLDIIDALLSDPALEGWDGFGVVVQAYSKRALPVIDWLYSRARVLDRRIMVRLVKGAYWDTEIKLAQVEGLPGFPVFTQKAATDISYLACAKRLFDYADRIYPQFATHNAHTVAAVLEMAPTDTAYEFQRLHGMGEALHANVLARSGKPCRIYAPVGAHKDLLAYLVRRLLENGANSSFVNQIVDTAIPADVVAKDPIDTLAGQPSAQIKTPQRLFAPERVNAKGYDISDPCVLAKLIADRDHFKPNKGIKEAHSHPVINPATGTKIGYVGFTAPQEAEAVLSNLMPWTVPVQKRAKILRRAADLYEDHTPELFALLTHEAGKTLMDCIGELREAVDFLRYYAAQAVQQPGMPRGTFVCISPWNFPLAIFTGQIAAALSVGNAVLAKPAETTSLVATRAVALLHEAGVPKDALALVCGEGATLGPALCAHPKTAGIAFTGSTATAQAIHRAMAAHLPSDTPLIAETGGINAMIVDSTALLEQAVQDIVTSAFQSAGQRCSALRMLYVQDDIAEDLKVMLFGAMEALVIGDPTDPAVDIGPVINAQAKARIDTYIAAAKAKGAVLKQIQAPDRGTFVGPAVITVSGITEVTQEVFGPVLHIATFRAEELDAVIEDINATGYGLTFGLHTRIDGRIQHIIDQVHVGNLYVNRNQIGAVVGSQPFGGHGLSGTGPKAGGPRYLSAFCASALPTPAPKQLPGPTGESNTYRIHPQNGIFCAGPGEALANQQARQAQALGCCDVTIAPEATPDDVAKAEQINVVLHWGSPDRAWREACARRDGPIVKLVTSKDLDLDLTTEQVVCVDTTAAGGNAELLGANA